MKRKLRLVLAVVVSVMPIGILRRLLYALMFGYSLQGSKIGFGTIIAVAQADIRNCVVGRFYKFVGPMKISFRDARIGSDNTFVCGEWTADSEFANRGYARCVTMAPHALITAGHYFDVAGRIDVGEDTWIAGRGSQFWTHGVGTTQRDIAIGRQCYIGSAVRFAPGARIGDRTLVAMGSVVADQFTASDCLLGGVPARTLKENHSWEFRPQVIARRSAAISQQNEKKVIQ